ncbi:TPA: DUF475 domain-containing protein [Candidatus Micrarchaeota archaeon]|nr:DUF475 domain-containing protein [Candidatus Micrarchaeota archaeon]
MFDIFSIILIVLALILFETITSIDNAIINADVLSKMGAKARRWFLVWGLLIAVFLVRGVLPTLLIYFSTPGIGIEGAITATFSDDPRIAEAIESTSPILLMGGGMFLLFLFLHWLFLERKNFGLRGEEFFQKQGVWFFALAAILLSIIVWFSLQVSPMLAFGAVMGSTAFFIVHGFRENAEKKEKEIIEGKTSMSDWSKIFYLEVIDATFSIDGVLGAFAFTFSIPLILLGNGIGAFVVREITIHNVDRVRKYIFLKNGAMYSIMVLGSIMVLDAFGYHIPNWFSPLATFGVVGFFFFKSRQQLKRTGQNGVMQT